MKHYPDFRKTDSRLFLHIVNRYAIMFKKIIFAHIIRLFNENGTT